MSRARDVGQFPFCKRALCRKCQTKTGPDEIQLSGEAGSLRIARGGVTSLEMRGCGFAAYGN